MNHTQDDPALMSGDEWTLLDFTNAFITVDMSQMFEEVRSQVLALSA